ncbi:Putative transposase (plasmid) [Cupriavidus necator H16]|uniref:Putative transposase n=1 Tax=Cupriavidus necator (strain ATCC 17699 / DSM 428 / KCTC 22496 / NCIMB 10442 / H16 / Stanier 337) TaxID=381666 RepID=Q7WXQ8_CUPNH|nr:putative transposase [Cupriavidus necator H16]
MRRDTQKQAEPKGTYRVKNWAQYNAGLIARGDVTMWIDQSVLASPGVGVSKRGRPCVYSDAVIQMLLGLKQVFRLPLRALQGFAMSLRKLAFADLPVPNYSTLSRRAQDLNVVLPVQRASQSLHLVVDSTGLKVFGVCASQERFLDTRTLC